MPRSTVRLVPAGLLALPLALAPACLTTDDDSLGSGPGGSQADTGGGGRLDASTSDAPSGGGDDEWEAYRIACVDRINGFRATLDLPPLERWVDAEACTDEQSAADAANGGFHANFGDCGERAQNTCPGWPNADAIIESCLQMMWDEGPGEDFNEHGHFLNMSSTGYARVACGFARTSDGGIWHNHNFTR